MDSTETFPALLFNLPDSNSIIGIITDSDRQLKHTSFALHNGVMNDAFFVHKNAHLTSPNVKHYHKFISESWIASLQEIGHELLQ